MEREEKMMGLKSPLIQVCGGNVSESKKKASKDEIFAEVKRLLSLAGPLVSVNFLLQCIQVISLMFVGHLGELPLAGASMATSFCSGTGFSLLIGTSTALETLCGQAYGAKQYHMLGLHMQRAMFVLLLICLPLAFIWANTYNILSFFGQDKEIMAEAGLYSCYMIPSVFAFAILLCLFKFLQAQNNVVPMTITTAFTTLLNFPICWALVFKSSLGSKGAALASAISYWINVLMLAAYVKFSPSCNLTWTGFSKEAFQDVPKFLRIGIPSAIMVCLEIWSYEMMVLVSGLLPNPQLEASVLSINVNTSAMMFMIPLGLGGAVSTRVSNELGAGRPQEARLSVRAVLFMVGIEATFAAAIMILGRNFWGYSYSKDVEIVKYVAEMMWLLALTHFLDCFQSVLSGVARGCGRQKIGAYVNLGAYYLLGIPSALVLGFVFHFGGKGLWTGAIVAVFVQSVALLTITWRTDWEKEAKRATDGVYAQKVLKDGAEV
ncbi:Multi antimicrobial extrusion protein [Dillenia turbinata]|uniref:Protein DETOXIFICATION n=1 Tax=Dillenia turbinata TaxID=194707 RepID=A0AAN8VYX0_9MAGN